MASSSTNKVSCSAPPPTPLSKPISSDAADVLSTLLHRLPPSLSFPPRRPPSNSPSAVPPPIISLAQQKPNLHSDLLLAARQTGFFQLTDHSVPSKLAHAAESETRSIFALPRDQKLLLGFPSDTWPLGFDFDDEEEDNNHDPTTLCLDSSCSTHSATDLSLSSLREFTREMERLGLEVIQLLSESLGLINPVRNDPTRICSLLWLSESNPSSRMYPYVVGLQYQIRCQKYSLQPGSGSGLMSVSPQIDSVLVSLGDIAKVWSNGRIKNVRGRPIPITEDPKHRYISMSLLLSLPLDSSVSPLLLSVEERDILKEKEDGNKDADHHHAAMKFSSFSFEDYAWRVYHERLPTKDPLDRYLI